jgi:hypothetical protein
LENLTLQFFLKLQIALQIDQAQTVLASQGVARWSFSLKDSCVRTTTEKCANTQRHDLFVGFWGGNEVGFSVTLKMAVTDLLALLANLSFTSTPSNSLPLVVGSTLMWEDGHNNVAALNERRLPFALVPLHELKLSLLVAEGHAYRNMCQLFCASHAIL